MKKIRLAIFSASLAMLGSISIHAQVTGSGTTNYIPMWTGTGTLGNSKLYQSGTQLGIDMTSPAWALDVNGHINASSSLLIGGFKVVDQNNSLYNVALGVGTLGTGNGRNNTALGANALSETTTGTENTATGEAALLMNSSGSFNTATGNGALNKSTTGSSNVAFGYSALLNNTTGENNIAIGTEAAASVTGTNSNNIHIGAMGSPGDSAVIRIGNNQTSFFAIGIRGATTGLSGAVPVVIDANGQMGTISSSIRFKEDVQDMASASSGLLRLRPVTYRYKTPYADGSKPVDYGLIAEEVAEVYPDLVARNADGQVETVQYQKLTPMMLNEMLKEHQMVEHQAETIRLLEKRLAALEGALHSGN